MDLKGFLWIWMVPGLGFEGISVDLDGPRPWICKDFSGFGGSQALDLEGFRWIWRVPGLGFEGISAAKPAQPAQP